VRIHVTSAIELLKVFLIEKGMRMDDPIPTFSYLIKKLKGNQPNLAYIHLIEPRMAGNAFDNNAPDGNNDIFRDIWAPKAIITAGGFSRESAIKRAEEHGDLIAFGRYFISNVRTIHLKDTLILLALI
jgi:NADPH2 dehydrogenase